MRVNEPITAHEIEVPEGEPLVSRTDTTGKITFVNHVFAAVSGFSEHELLGSPHNLVRHPTMPAAAFADLWATIKAGRPWDGLVKNRARTGDFYWVKANVTPELKDGKVIGYISIRSKPSRADTAEAERIYAGFRTGAAGAFGLRDGMIVRRSPGIWLRDRWNSVAGRMLAVTLTAVLAIVLIGWFDFAGVAASTARLAALHDRDLTAMERLRGVQDLLRDGRAGLAQVTIGLARGVAPEGALAGVRTRLQQGDVLWRAWRAEPLTVEQERLAARFEAAAAALRTAGIEPALAAAARGDGAAAASLFATTLPPLFEAALDVDNALIAAQAAVGSTAYAEAAGALDRHLLLTGLLAVLGLVPMGLLGWRLLATLRRSLGLVEAACRTITAGNYTGTIGAGMAREFAGVTAMLRAMRAHLAFSDWERAEHGRRADVVRHETVERMAEAIEQEAGGAVHQVAERSIAMAADAEAMAGSAERVGGNAERVMAAADQALRNAQVVAAASEQLAASIREIAGQIEQASGVAQEGASRGEQARRTIGSLSEATERIGAIVALINNIAAQTNLLALNATIEASRAGEAGRGFAVVAGEVKNLAAQTAQATEEISRQIGALRDATSASVAVVGEIGRTLDTFAAVSTSIAAAIEEQTSATHEIARNVAENGAAVQAVTSLIAEVSQEATLVGRQAGTLRATAGTVAGDVDALRQALVRTVRTATDEANRRTEARVPVDLACTLRFGEKSLKGRLTDLSHSGAAVVAAGSGAVAGMEGTLALDGIVDAETQVVVRAIEHAEHLHLQFIAGSARPGFPSAIERALHAAAGIRQARTA